MTTDEKTDSNETLAGQGKRDNVYAKSHQKPFSICYNALVDAALPSNAKILWQYLESNASSFLPTLATIAKHIGISKPTAINAKSILARHNMITIVAETNKYGGERHYLYTNDPSDWADMQWNNPRSDPEAGKKTLLAAGKKTLLAAGKKTLPIKKTKENKNIKLTPNPKPDNKSDRSESDLTSNSPTQKTKLQDNETYQKLMTNKAKRFEAENEENQKLMALKSELGVTASKLPSTAPRSRKSVFDQWFSYFKTSEEVFPYDQIYRCVDAAIAKGKVDQVETILKTEHREGKPTVATHCRNYKISATEYVTMIIEHGCRDLRPVHQEPEQEQPKATPEVIKRFSKKLAEHKKKLGYR